MSLDHFAQEYIKHANTNECLSLNYLWILWLEAPWQSPVGYRLPLELRPCFTNPKGKEVFRPNFDVTGKCRLMHHFVWKWTLFFESFIYSKKKKSVFLKWYPVANICHTEKLFFKICTYVFCYYTFPLSRLIFMYLKQLSTPKIIF